MKLVSIIMPAYNAGCFIEESIQSVLAQRYENWELIIIDDCSTDSTCELIESYDDSRIILLKNVNNSGAAIARNIGISHSKGCYLAFLDSDDLWAEDKLFRQINVLETCQEVVACHSSYDRIDREGNNIGRVQSKPKVTRKDMLKSNCIGNLTGIYDITKVGTILQKTIRHEDYLMWVEVLSQEEGSFSIGLSESLASYRVHQSSISANKFKSAQWHWQVLRKHLEINMFVSLYCFGMYVINGIKNRK